MFCVSQHVVRENLCVVIVNRHHRFHTLYIIIRRKDSDTVRRNKAEDEILLNNLKNLPRSTVRQPF